LFSTAETNLDISIEKLLGIHSQYHFGGLTPNIPDGLTDGWFLGTTGLLVPRKEEKEFIETITGIFTGGKFG